MCEPKTLIPVYVETTGSEETLRPWAGATVRYFAVPNTGSGPTLEVGPATIGGIGVSGPCAFTVPSSIRSLTGSSGAIILFIEPKGG